MTSHLTNMARYNQWVSQRLFDKVQLLPYEEIAKDRGAFFGPILGALNHILVDDIFWLHRFSSSKLCKYTLALMREIAMPTSLRDVLFDDIQSLRSKREAKDTLILDFSAIWTDEILVASVRYRNKAGEKHRQPLGTLLQHLFNHQPHHRGQVMTLLFQASIGTEATDLIEC